MKEKPAHHLLFSAISVGFHLRKSGVRELTHISAVIFLLFDVLRDSIRGDKALFFRGLVINFCAWVTLIPRSGDSDPPLE
ncbi:hypothetical protein [Puniceibacterium sp. IMCC21224]|uniref:hypothetical protein n=1 Tax=Puniceibacterium sp. IMCC21224 TaxID=1618204 RepID=UPI00064D7CDB|nr:hypothetical protein [Puniceibacterium sp. IMCC21224]